MVFTCCHAEKITNLNLAPLVRFQGRSSTIAPIRRWLSLSSSFLSKVLTFLVPRKPIRAVKSLLGVVWQGAHNVHVAHTYGGGLRGRAANPNTVRAAAALASWYNQY